jgi:type II secretory pathway component PulJ
MLMSLRLRRRQLGMSLVELMVGIAVGMFVVAAAATLVSTQLSENRRLLLEVQVQQDLRATVDIVTRELRRAGSLPFITDAPALAWTPGGAPWGPDRALPVVNSTAGPASEVTFRSNRSQGGDGPYGFRLRDGAVESQVQAGTWQKLTDRATLEVTNFTVTVLSEPAIVVACAKLCTDPANPQGCWPRVRVRSYQIDATGRAETDHAVVRSIRSVVRLKNDELTTDPALGTRSCPG